MHMKHYVKEWLNGIGRSDLARLAEKGELPELDTPEAKECFGRFQKKEASPADFLHEIMGFDAPPTSPPIK